MFSRKRMEKISQTDRVGNEEEYIGSRINSMKANMVGHNLRRNFLLRHFFEGNL
jgi:hypothetical protein